MTSRSSTLLGAAFAHWLTTAGVVITTTSAFVFLGLAFLRFDNPYYGLVVFVLIPALFVLGLFLIPLGLYIKGRRVGGLRNAIPAVEWSSPRTVRLAGLIGILTMANITSCPRRLTRVSTTWTQASFAGPFVTPSWAPTTLDTRTPPMHASNA